MMKILDNKVFRVISSIVEWLIIAILVLLIVLVGFQKFSSKGNFFGYRIYTIISGSMIPTYGVGDTLLIKEMNSDNIKIGDAVTYLGDGGSMNGKIITHQVVGIEFDENGKYLFHTKGVANNIEDPIVFQDQVLGKVVHKFLFLSVLGKVTTSMSLLFTFIIIPMAIIIAIEIAKLVYKKDDEDEEEKEEDTSPIEEKEEDNKEEKQEETKVEDTKEEVVENTDVSENEENANKDLEISFGELIEIKEKGLDTDKPVEESNKKKKKYYKKNYYYNNYNKKKNKSKNLDK